ncbi:MAG: FadR/GntR family transcriptional regulator [Chloroflexota bacterium]
MAEKASRSETESRMKLDLGSFHVPKASEILAHELREKILRKWPAGTVMPTERELATQLGVSRMTVREALRILEAEGLVHMRQGRKGGPIAQRPDDRNVARALAVSIRFEGSTFGELLETRRLVEPLCARCAAERATLSDIRNLRDSNARYQRSLQDYEACILENLQFHLLVAAASHNTILKLLAASLKTLVHQCTADLELNIELREAVLEVHERIVDAIEAGNADLAQRRMEKHLLANEEVFRRRYGDPARMQFGSELGELYLVPSG